MPDEFLSNQRSFDQIVDEFLTFIDGNHQDQHTIFYFNECLKYANNDTIFIFDDIHIKPVTTGDTRLELPHRVVLNMFL